MICAKFWGKWVQACEHIQGEQDLSHVIQHSDIYDPLSLGCSYVMETLPHQ